MVETIEAIISYKQNMACLAFNCGKLKEMLRIKKKTD